MIELKKTAGGIEAKGHEIPVMDFYDVVVIGGGVADHTPIVPLARKKCAEMLNGYIVTPEVNDIDTYIVNNSLEGKQGIMGCLALGAQALQ